jgi:hypothetical protein
MNPQLLYQSLLAETDNEAKYEYEVDPRIAQYALRNTDDDREVPGYETSTAFASPQQPDPEITKIPEEEREMYEAPMFEQPALVPNRRVVIVDTAQRDWTVQPDAYSVTFGFGNQNPNTVTSNTQIPYYFNNPVVPYAAYDMPTYNGVGVPPPQRANNKPIRLGFEDSNTFQYGLLANTWGWRLVRDNTTGLFVHSDTVPESNINTSQYSVVYFPVYDSANSRGSLIGVDSQIPDPGDVQDTFSTQTALSNIGSIRLVRATLPVRKFDTFNPAVFSQASTSGNIAIVQSLNPTAANLINTFHSEPYILMSIGSIQGGYLGANNIIQNSFAALVQKQRITLDGNNTAYLAQFQDYFPWSDEAYTFDPPLSYLSNADITLSNQLGQPYSHLDDMVITSIQFGTCQSPITTGTPSLNITQYFGTMTFTIYHGNVPQIINSVPIFDINQQFSTNEIRVGDELVFYQPTLQKILQDPSTSSNSALQTFFSNLATHSILVTNTITVPLYMPFAFNETTQVGFQFTGVFKFSNLADVFAISSNLNDVISTLGSSLGGPVPQLTLTSTITASDYYSNSYPIPFLNRMMQCTYAFEVTTMEPDTSGLGKIVAL